MSTTTTNTKNFFRMFVLFITVFMSNSYELLNASPSVATTLLVSTVDEPSVGDAPLIVMKKFRNEKYSDEELISIGKRLYEELGRPICSRDWRDCEYATSIVPYTRAFGGWIKFMKHAKIPFVPRIVCQKARDIASANRRGKKGYNNRGGRKITKEGYVCIWMPEHPNSGSIGYIKEHRLVMSNHLGRPLVGTESVHHKNGIRDDNRIENLELMTQQVHRGTVVCPHCQKDFCIR